MKYLFTILLLYSIVVKGQTKKQIWIDSTNIDHVVAGPGVVKTKDQHGNIAFEKLPIRNNYFERKMLEVYDEYIAFNKSDTLHPHYHKWDYLGAEVCNDSLHICQEKNAKVIAEREKARKENEQESKNKTSAIAVVVSGISYFNYYDKSMKTVRFYQKPMSFEKFIEYLRKK
jgi:hypothetical protein